MISVPEWSSDISGNKQLGPKNSSPTSDCLSDVKFGKNLDVLAEITYRGFLTKENSHFQIIISQRNPHIINEMLFLDVNRTSIFLS